MSDSFDTSVKAGEALERHEFDEAIRLFRTALAQAHREDDESRWFIEGRLGDALMQAGHAIEAQMVLEQSLASGSDIPATVGMLRQLYYAADDYDGLERLIRAEAADIAKAEPPYFIGDPGLLMLARRSTQLATAGLEDQRALQRAEALAQHFGNSLLEWAVRHQRGAWFEAMGDVDGAIATYKSLINDGSRHDATIERLLILLERESRDDEALRLTTKLAAALRPGPLRDSVAKRAARLAKGVGKTRAKPRPPKPITRLTFGARLAQTALPEDALAFETGDDRAGRWEYVDALTGRLLADRLAGNAIATGRYDRERVDVPSLTAADRAILEDRYAIERIEARGSWGLPDELRIAGDLIAPNRSEGERAHSALKGNPEAIFLWAVLEPLYHAIHSPLAIRERFEGRSGAQQKADWQSVYDLFSQLGLDVRLELDPMRYGGWSRLTAAERADAAMRLSSELVTWAPHAARTFRALMLRDLAKAYYAKADKDGHALRRRVITATLRRPFIAYFSGDWLDFVQYLGETPDPSEKIFTALPAPVIRVAGASQAVAAARDLGIPAEEAAKIASAYWGADLGESPVEARVAALKRYWTAFDSVHACQAKGMPSLWGLVVESDDAIEFQFFEDGRRTPYAFAKTLPLDVLDEIDRLWGGVIKAGRPDVIVTASSPHHLVAQAFGPALEFWNGIALTAWFICEGPYSRTSLEHAEEYYGKRLAELETAGTPVVRSLFRELISAQRLLKERPLKSDHASRVDVGRGISFTLTMSVGPAKLDGFEHLRNVITKHRRIWTERHIDTYLRGRWDSAVRGASLAYRKLLSESGKPPTIRGFARKVVPVTNQWFGGDIGALYAAIGEPCPVTAKRADRRLPRDAATFGERVAASLPRLPKSRSTSDAVDWEQSVVASDICRFAIRWLQLWEALGHEPSLDEAGRDVFVNAQTVRLRTENYREYRLFGPDTGEAFDRFVAMAKGAMSGLDAVAPQSESPSRSAATVVLPPPVETEGERTSEAPRGLFARIGRILMRRD